MRVSHLPGTAPSTSYVLTHFILTLIDTLVSSSMKEETEAQRGGVMCPRLQQLAGSRAGFEPRPSGSTYCNH